MLRQAHHVVWEDLGVALQTSRGEHCTAALPELLPPLDLQSGAIMYR